MSSFEATPADSELPPVDERLVEPETPYEILDGVLVHVPPADPPHAILHSKVSALVEAHAAPDFQVASDMLTRTSKVDDFAPDVSVFPRARDPRTGGRQLEHLAFEVVSTESLSHTARKAAKLVARGVRRVFAIHVDRGRVLEWSQSLAGWSVLDASADLEDPALAAPLPVRSLLATARTDDTVARALLVKRNAVLEAATAAAAAAARQQGLAEAVLAILAARRIAVGGADRTRILAEDPARLLRWTVRATTCGDIAELLGDR
jgi:Uma2 family endonuclease